jgi:hypothetical protein
MSYNKICFSIFFEDKKNIIGRIGELFFERKKLRDIKLVSCKTKMIDWINPKYGEKEVFFIGSNLNINHTIFMSNVPDGWMNMASFFPKKVGCKCVQIRISTVPESGIFEYRVLQNEKIIRIIQLIQDPKWKFFSEGDPLPYEDVSIYENRLMKNKFNEEIIKAYLKAEGVDFDTLISGEYTGVKYETISWEYLD